MRHEKGKLVSNNYRLRYSWHKLTPMVLAEIYSNEFAKVEVNLEHKFIQVTWLQHTSGTPAREVLEVALQFARGEGLTNWLHDMRKIDYITLAGQSWTANEFFAAFDYELHHRLAWVASPKSIDMVPDALIQEAIRQNPVLAKIVEMRVFLDMETAEYWLSQ
ncbi:hypothetical protein ACFSKU_14755 [Pontibacter silvestris]|uniref:STAS/SEC14 domain-containing protein n=1 Tax=Pontibacter silvestris TaxID=2305183 RepID=A0ABW4X186_9BACT|nr:hypothetical protein [Pontibacter silvestris]MCC9138969.1 hypothetical protein [Pontibacter silvestris]